MRKNILLASLLGLGLLLGCERTFAATDQADSMRASGKPAAEVPGVDLSKWQGEVDFARIKSAGKAYVFIKATQGTGGVDPNYKRNMQGARAAGLVAGSYHFYMTDDTAERQFANFSRHIVLQAGDLPPVVDIEILSANSLPDTAAELTRFLGLIEQKYGVKPIIYSGESFANAHLKGFADYPLWLAEYNKDKAPQMPLDWKQWTFWQHSQNGRVAGVSGPVDLNRFNGDMAKLEALRIK